MEANSGQSTPSPTPPSFPPAPDSHWQQWSPALLQKTILQGTTALNNRQYEQAIALLEPIVNYIQQPESIALVHRALAKAYMAQKDGFGALRYCQALQEHSDPTAQKWARKAIAHLQQQYPQLDLSSPLDPTVMPNDGNNLELPLSPTLDTVVSAPVSSPSQPSPTPTPIPKPADVRAEGPPSESTKSAPISPPNHRSPTSPPKRATSTSPPLTDPGFKPLSTSPRPKDAPTSHFAELLSKLDQAPPISPESEGLPLSTPTPQAKLHTSPPPPQAQASDTLLNTTPDVASGTIPDAASDTAPDAISGAASDTGTSVSSGASNPLASERSPSDPPDSNLLDSAPLDSNLLDPSADRTLVQLDTLVQAVAEPSDVTPTPPRQPTTAIATLPWKQADRAKRWSPIPHKLTFVRRLNTFFTYGWTAIALWGMATLFVRVGMTLGNPVRDLVSRMIRFNRWYFLEYYPGRIAAVILAGLLLLAPLILHLWLCWGHKTRRFTLTELGRHSPEAEKLLQRSCKKHKHPLPRLRRMATQTPLLLSYGWRPRLAWIVVSDGLLRQLSDDEIAALYAAELNHVRQWSLWLMTGFTVATQISYSGYRFWANWGDRRNNSFLQWLGGAGAAIAYGMFWLVRNTGLWLARSRRRHSDRMAANLTGNPNGLTRGLLKFAIATATDIRRQGKTEPILEQFEWLMPVGYRSAISTGSVFPVQWQSLANPEGKHPDTPVQEATILTWEYRNPHRDWMNINNTHPPLGDRLYTLSRYAQHWRLEPELHLPSLPRISDGHKMERQMAPFMGLPIGAGISLLLWVVGLVAHHFDWPIEWLRYEAPSIFWGMLAMGFSFGTILRMNDFFPDIPPLAQREVDQSQQKQGEATPDETDLADLLVQPDRLPIDSQPVYLHGKLLGRKGVGNWLNQDLILQTQTGMVRLHCISMLGTIGHLVFNVIRLNSLKGRTVKVAGWLRRGATPWIDVDTIQAQRGQPIQAGHPIWSIFLAGMLTLWGAYILYRTNL
ncbi:MAG: M48 family metalloprotease [Leptolyngbyaceae cyanobacterium]